MKEILNAFPRFATMASNVPSTPTSQLSDKRINENENVLARKKRKHSRKTIDILLTIHLADRFYQKPASWIFGVVKTWKNERGDSCPILKVEYSNSTQSSRALKMVREMGSVDTTKFDAVMDTLTWNPGPASQYWSGKWMTTTNPKDWPESCQRFLLEAFDENFANSPGRNGLHALLTSLLTSSALTIYNIGGGSRKNKKLGRLGIQYNYYNSENVRLEKIDLEESTSESSPEKSLSSPEKSLSLSEKSSPEKSSPEKSTDSSTSSTTTEYDATHTPVVDCLVTGPDTSILVGSLKSGPLRPEHLEQLRLELLSQISLDARQCRVAGVLICELEANLFIAAKDPGAINITHMSSYKFTNGNHTVVFSQFLTDLVNLVKACETQQDFPLE